MNDVQIKYAPPRLAAVILAVIVFAFYQLIWRDILVDNFEAATRPMGAPVALPMAIIFSIIIGYGLSMLGWLILKTKGQIRETFRPTRGRLVGALFLVGLTPFTNIHFLPWVIGALLPALIFAQPLTFILFSVALFLIGYPIAAMIVRHTYQRKWLRLGLFALAFWTSYSVVLLAQGVQFLLV